MEIQTIITILGLLVASGVIFIQIYGITINDPDIWYSISKKVF